MKTEQEQSLVIKNKEGTLEKKSAPLFYLNLFWILTCNINDVNNVISQFSAVISSKIVSTRFNYHQIWLECFGQVFNLLHVQWIILPNVLISYVNIIKTLIFLSGIFE